MQQVRGGSPRPTSPKQAAASGPTSSSLPPSPPVYYGDFPADLPSPYRYSTPPTVQTSRREQPRPPHTSQPPAPMPPMWADPISVAPPIAATRERHLFPDFNGERPQQWLYKTDKYFRYHNIVSDPQKIVIGIFKVIKSLYLQVHKIV